MKHTWTGWLKTQRSPEAGIFIAIGGNTPRYTGKRLETLRRNGSIDKESYDHRVKELGILEQRFALREDVDVRDPGDWVPLNDDGGRMRATHLHE